MRVDGADHLGEMLRPAVGQIVAVHRGDHHMLQAQLLHRARRHWPARPASSAAGQSGLDVAEGAGAGAGVAHDHHGGVAPWSSTRRYSGRPLPRRRCAACARAPRRGWRHIPRETGALTRIQSGLRRISWSGRCAFSGWRGLRWSMTTVMDPYKGPGGQNHAQLAGQPCRPLLWCFGAGLLKVTPDQEVQDAGRRTVPLRGHRL